MRYNGDVGCVELSAWRDNRVCESASRAMQVEGSKDVRLRGQVQVWMELGGSSAHLPSVACGSMRGVKSSSRRRMEFSFPDRPQAAKVIHRIQQCGYRELNREFE